MGINYFNSKKYPRGIRLVVVLVFLGLIAVQFSSEFHRSVNSFWRPGATSLAKNAGATGKTHGATAISNSRQVHISILDKRYHVSIGFIIPGPPAKIETPYFYIGKSVNLLPVSYTSANNTAATLRGPPASLYA